MHRHMDHEETGKHDTTKGNDPEKNVDSLTAWQRTLNKHLEEAQLATREQKWIHKQNQKKQYMNRVKSLI